ncbi:hypothetical protein MUP95_10315, partial [bacterium]|nr:hypothetical protein [bacterium]
MLTFDDVGIAVLHDVENISPNEYLSWRIHDAFYCHRSAYKAMEKRGLRAVLEDNCIEIVCDHPEKFLSSINQGISHEMKNQILRELYNPPKIASQLQNLKDWAMHLSSESKAELIGVPIGVAPIPLFNAGAGPVPAGGTVVLMNDGMWGIEIMLSYFKRIQASGGNGFTALAQPLADCIRGLNNVSPLFTFADAPILDFATEQEIAKLREFLLCYVLLHEYGHIALGHVEALRHWRKNLVNRDGLIKRRAQMRQWEFESDSWAAERLLRGCKNQAEIEGMLFLSHIFAVLHICHRLNASVDKSLNMIFPRKSRHGVKPLLNIFVRILSEKGIPKL